VPPTGLDAWASLLAYEGAARRLVTGLKYRDDRVALAWLADGMAALLDPPAGAIVTWAPTSARRRRRRGFDQAELLARAVARRWCLPCRRLLVRRGPSRPQTGASLSERQAGPRLAASAHRRPLVPTGVPAAVVVVDDVVTTGATLRAAAGALRGAGVMWVGGITAARTARHSAPSRHSVPAFSPGVNKSLKLGPEPAEYGW
jgi:predicted amidophosphoribosyltransferase